MFTVYICFCLHLQLLCVYYCKQTESFQATNDSLCAQVIDDPVSTKLLMVMEHVQGGPIMPEGSSSTCMSEQVVVHYFRDMCMVRALP
jgi:serine/threonine protein kinase